MQLTQKLIADRIREKAMELGFSAIGFANAERLADDEVKLKTWLENGYHATMHYMANNFEKRVNPALLVDGTQTVISVLLNYFPSATPKYSDAPVVSRYAYGEDYHDVMKEKLNQLFEFIRTSLYPNLEGRVFVDSAPVLERAWAARAGLGWVGKNTNLIHPQLGSWFFIGELLVNMELPASNPINDYCGGCTKCIDACPTKAILKPRVLDANRCISYLTIENKDDIPDEFAGEFENRVYGCDICQEVCPWNRKAKPHNVPAFEPKPQLMELTRQNWIELTEDQYRELFKGSAVKRAKYSGLKRNVQFLNQKTAQ
jgi:epoxyqueuosine reductase